MSNILYIVYMIVDNLIDVKTKYLSSLIRKRRKELSLKQSDLARLCGLTESAICRYENGSRFPKPEALIRIAEVLGIETGELFKIEE